MIQEIYFATPTVRFPRRRNKARRSRFQSKSGWFARDSLSRYFNVSVDQWSLASFVDFEALAAMGGDDGEIAPSPVWLRMLLMLALDLAYSGEGALIFLCEEPSDEVLKNLLHHDEGLIKKDLDMPVQELTVRGRFTQSIGEQRNFPRRGSLFGFNTSLERFVWNRWCNRFFLQRRATGLRLSGEATVS